MENNEPDDQEYPGTLFEEDHRRVSNNFITNQQSSQNHFINQLNSPVIK